MTGGSGGAYTAALKMLARRELSEAQVRSRLTRRQFDPDAIDSAVSRLLRERAIDDRRTALACARTELVVRRRGRLRALRQVQALGIAPDVARAAVREVFADVDERSLLEQVLDRRLRQTALDEAGMRRLHRYLLGQGFSPGLITTALKGRARHAHHDD